MFLAYLMRHGNTALSPQSEGWLPIPLNKVGQEQVIAGADFLEQYTRNHPKPSWAISSDLTRAEQTRAIVSKMLGIKEQRSMQEIRAYEKASETPFQYEERNLKGFESILGYVRRTGRVALIVAHRSTTAFLEKTTAAKKGEKWQPDYRFHSLLLEGGILGITDEDLIPLFRTIEENWQTSASHQR